MTDVPVDDAPAPAVAEPRLIVFGTDEAKRPHAAWFAEADADAAERAAGFMRMRVLKIETDDQRALALQLPQGRVFASGKAFTPFIKAGLYDRLSAFEGAYESAIPIVSGDVAPQRETVSYHLPKSWDDMGPGSLVLTFDGVYGGWYETIVIERKSTDYVVLRWRDWPEFPDFVRSQASLALLPVDLDTGLGVIPA